MTTLQLYGKWLDSTERRQTCMCRSESNLQEHFHGILKGAAAVVSGTKGDHCLHLFSTLSDDLQRILLRTLCDLWNDVDIITVWSLMELWRGEAC